MEIKIPLTRPNWDRFLETSPSTAERLKLEIGPDPIEYSPNHPSFLLLNLTIMKQVEYTVPRMVLSDDYDLQILVTPNGKLAKSFWGRAGTPTIWISAETLARVIGYDSVGDLLLKDF